jgi:A/G-specific adenine glycosylase
VPESTRFAQRVIDWQRRAGRHHLPWQNTTDPYPVWLSEIMLQQTQVAAVIPYFLRFVGRFPSIAQLAAAPEDGVLAAWSGLGYYARARNLHRAAREILQRHQGNFPERFDDILALPGVGRSTAGAIAVFAFGQRFPILDGNVKRVLARCFAIDGYPGSKIIADRLWALADRLVPDGDVQAYTQGLMDLGTQVCVRRQPHCSECPLSDQCLARLQRRVDVLPTPRPRKERPRRSTVMLILEHDGNVMLEKRPRSGIWGGLWSFPEIDAIDDAQQLCQHRFGVVVKSAGLMTPLEHGFTHFSLNISPLRCQVTQRGARVESPGRMWVQLADATTYAIPVPVRKLVALLTNSQAD